MGSGASSKQKYRSSSNESTPRSDAKSQDATSPPRSPKSKRHVRLRGHKLTIVPPKHQTNGRKAIQWTKSIDDIYSFGTEVMPSTNYGTVVLFAKRLLDDKEVVVKVRDKAKAFRDVAYEQEWRHTTETILNLPRHEHITELFEVLEDEEAYFVIMERAEGMDLFETLLGPQRPAREEIQDILKKLLAAIAALHAKGYIHRDLKLENVMVDRTPKSGGGRTPKTIDLSVPVHTFQSWMAVSSVSTVNSTPSGISNASTTYPSGPTLKLIDFDTVEDWSPRTPKSKMVLGTDMYIPVEAYSGRYSPASDIFSIGVIAYKLLTGRYPFSDSCFPVDKGDNMVGSPSMMATQKNLEEFVVDWSLPPFDEDADAVDLVRSMLDVIDDNRPTATKALEHRWFATTK